MKTHILIFSFFTLLIAKSYAQKEITIDLASQTPGVVLEENIEPNTLYNFHITNMIVSDEKGNSVYYEIVINYERQLPAALPNRIPQSITSGTTCSDLIKKGAGKINAAADEDTIGAIIEEYTKKLLDARCDDLQTLQRMVTRRIYTGTVREEYTLVVTIKRGDKVWTRKFITEPRGKWMVSYGLTFPSNFIIRDHAFYTEQDTAPNRFFIREGNRAKIRGLDLRPIPTVYYTWQKNNSRNWSNSLIAGLGLDLTEPVVTLGWNWMYHYNIGISGGLVLAKKDVLKEKYSKDQIVTTALDFEGLHDRKYRPDLYFSVVFRFGENPFKQKSPEKLEKPQPTESSTANRQ